MGLLAEGSALLKIAAAIAAVTVFPKATGIPDSFLKKYGPCASDPAVVRCEESLKGCAAADGSLFDEQDCACFRAHRACVPAHCYTAETWDWCSSEVTYRRCQEKEVLCGDDPESSDASAAAIGVGVAAAAFVCIVCGALLWAALRVLRIRHGLFDDGLGELRAVLRQQRDAVVDMSVAVRSAVEWEEEETWKAVAEGVEHMSVVRCLAIWQEEEEARRELRKITEEWFAALPVLAPEGVADISTKDLIFTPHTGGADEYVVTPRGSVYGGHRFSPGEAHVFMVVLPKEDLGSLPKRFDTEFATAIAQSFRPSFMVGVLARDVIAAEKHHTPSAPSKLARACRVLYHAQGRPSRGSTVLALENIPSVLTEGRMGKVSGVKLEVVTPRRVVICSAEDGLEHAVPGDIVDCPCDTGKERGVVVALHLTVNTVIGDTVEVRSDAVVVKDKGLGTIQPADVAVLAKFRGSVRVRFEVRVPPGCEECIETVLSRLLEESSSPANVAYETDGRLWLDADVQSGAVEGMAEDRVPVRSEPQPEVVGLSTQQQARPAAAPPAPLPAPELSTAVGRDSAAAPVASPPPPPVHEITPSVARPGAAEGLGGARSQPPATFHPIAVLSASGPSKGQPESSKESSEARATAVVHEVVEEVEEVEGEALPYLVFQPGDWLERSTAHPELIHDFGGEVGAVYPGDRVRVTAAWIDDLGQQTYLVEGGGANGVVGMERLYNPIDASSLAPWHDAPPYPLTAAAVHRYDTDSSDITSSTLTESSARTPDSLDPPWVITKYYQERGRAIPERLQAHMAGRSREAAAPVHGTARRGK